METSKPKPNSNPTPNEHSYGNSLSVQARHYFLDQGQKISQLQQLLDRGYLRAYLSRAVYWLAEIALYALFVIALISIYSIPTDLTQHIRIDNSNSVDVKFTNKELAEFISFLKLVFFILSLMPLILARVIRNARKKTKAIQASFEVVEEMKTNFDKALKELKF
jgi:hypothetical protein